MNKIAKITVLAFGAAMVTQALQAQINDGDLVIGFNSGTSTTDYVLDLGQVPTSANTQLAGSFDLSTFNSTFGSAAMNVGVVGGDPDGAIDPSGFETMWTTTLRTGVAATSFATHGTEAAPASLSQNGVDGGASTAVQVALGFTPTANSSSSAWNQVISKGPGQHGSNNTSFGQFANPMTALSSQPLTLDLWSANDGNTLNPFTYVGDLQIDLTGATPSIIFDPAVAVPEPASYGLLAGGGLLAIVLRRQFVRKTA
jgi:hypothetical protein